MLRKPKESMIDRYLSLPVVLSLGKCKVTHITNMLIYVTYWQLRVFSINFSNLSWVIRLNTCHTQPFSFHQDYFSSWWLPFLHQILSPFGGNFQHSNNDAWKVAQFLNYRFNVIWYVNLSQSPPISSILKITKTLI